MKKNETLTNFLDTKYIPLEPKFKLLLVLLIVALPIALFYFLFLQSNLEQIESLTAQKSSLEREVQNVKRKAQDLPRLEAELAETENAFEEMAALLPREKEIPKLLRDISSLGRNAGLDFLTFKPQPSIPKDFYAEIPVVINVRGPYHNVGYFFDQVSKLERIVSVSNTKMSSPKMEGGEMILNSDCRLVTYQFTNVELPKENKK